MQSDDERRAPIRPIGETADTVTLQRADYEALLRELDDAQTARRCSSISSRSR